MKLPLIHAATLTSVLAVGCAPPPENVRPMPTHSEPQMMQVNNIVPPATEAPSADEGFIGLIQQVQQRNAALEASQAAARGERFLYGWYAGRAGLKVPGTNGAQASCQIRTVDGLGDVIFGENHLKYRVEMRKFATAFNVAMLPNCQ